MIKLSPLSADSRTEQILSDYIIFSDFSCLSFPSSINKALKQPIPIMAVGPITKSGSSFLSLVWMTVYRFFPQIHSSETQAIFKTG